MKNNIKKHLIFLILLISCPLISIAHKHYISLYNIDYNPKTKGIEISVKVFIDDLEEAIGKRENESKKISIKKYMQKHFNIRVNDKKKDMNFLGFETELDSYWLFF